MREALSWAMACSACGAGSPEKLAAFDDIVGEIERLDTALTRAMDRGNELEAERDSLAARLRAQGYNVTEILMHDLSSAPVPEAPTPQ